MAAADPYWFVHPLIAILLLCGALTNLWLGLRVSAATTSLAVRLRLRFWHIRLGAALTIGGPVVLLLGLRGVAAAGWPLLGTFHGFMGLLLIGLLSMVGLTGLLLLRGREVVRPRHRLLVRLLVVLLSVQLLSGLSLIGRVLGGG